METILEAEAEDLKELEDNAYEVIFESWNPPYRHLTRS
jgi:hypothetical protein